MDCNLKGRSGNNIPVTDAILKSVEEFGYVQFSPEEVADYLMSDREEMQELLTGNANHKVSLSYHKGRLSSEYKLRKSIFDLAHSNSSNAQTIAKDYVNKNKLKLL